MLDQINEYYGEIGFSENEIKGFCILKKNKDNKISLTTNLINSANNSKVDIIFGVFTGLGLVTFINNAIVSLETGMIQSVMYEPEYTLIGDHFISNPKEFRINKISIVNADLRKWIKTDLFDRFTNKNSISFNNEINNSFIIDDYLKIFVKTTTSIKSLIGDYSEQLLSKASIDFEYIDDNKSILESIELYDKFQKFLLFFHGSTKRFESFKLTHVNCGKQFELIYNDNFNRDTTYSLLNLNYQLLKDELTEILKKWFLDGDLLICVDRILTNLISSRLSYSQRFVNSYIALECYISRFNEKEKTIDKFLKKNKLILSQITGMSDIEVNEHISLLIRTRKYYVHDDIKENKHFQGINLLYESSMLEYLVAIFLLKKLGVSKELVDKIIKKANCNYTEHRNINLALSDNTLKDIKLPPI